jgi:hypothetical protein
MFRPLLIALGMLALVVPAARADYSPEQLKADLQLFENAKLPHTDAALVDFFRKRMISSQDQARIEEIIKKLSSKVFKEREQATADLIKEGPAALPVLRKMINGTQELEIKKRCDRCVKEIEKKSPNTLVMAAARILKARQAPGACAVLLEYVAVAPDDVVEDEVFASIYYLALHGAKLEVFPPEVKAGKLDPVLIQALGDKESARRSIAALIVGQFGTDLLRKEVRKLLGDDDARVRVRAAHGLLVARDASGIPVLVETLRSGPIELALLAEDLLSLAAGDQAAAVPLTEKAEARVKCHAAWQAWWDKNKANFDTSKLQLDAPFGGLTARAGAGATAFIEALLKFDVALVTKYSDVPFSIGGVINFNTREELNAFVDMIKQGMKPENFTFKVKKVVSAADYMKTAPQPEASFLETSRPAQVHIVYVDAVEKGNTQSLPLFIRISGGRAKCIGAGIR